MGDIGLERAFEKVRAILEGDVEHPGLTRQDLERLVGYPERGEGPLAYTLPPQPGLEGVRAVRFFYYPRDPEVTLIVEIEDQNGKRHLRHLKWNGLAWVPPRGGLKSELTATRETVPVGLKEIQGDFYAGFTLEEAQALAERIRKGETAGEKYLLCPTDRTRILYSPAVSPATLSCPRCGSTALLHKTLPITPGASRGLEAKLEALLAEQTPLRQHLERLERYLKRKLGE